MTYPQQIGKYTITGIAGEGSMGVVYTGHDPFTDEDVAIKVCPVTAGNGFKLVRKLFFNEAHTAGGLDHPNILAVRDGGEHEGCPYIVMEYVDGADTLRSYIAPDNLLSIDRVIEILHQCAKALDYAHRRGVIHRDIKPSNIMLTRDGTVKIGDFGIAHHALSDETQVMGMLGSPRYMAPEQVSDDELTPQCDIFSLGVIAYELLTGVPPFAASTISLLVRKIVETEPRPIRELRPETPQALSAIIDKALAKKLSDRYQHARDMAGDLASLPGKLSHAPSEPAEREGFKIVRSLPFFNDFSDDEVREVTQAGTWRAADAAATLLAEHSPANAFYLMIRGEAVVRIQGIEISRVTKGECFGEMAVISGKVRGAAVIAVDECIVLRLDSALLERASPGCQIRLNQAFLRTLVLRLSISNQRLAQALKAGASGADAFGETTRL